MEDSPVCGANIVMGGRSGRGLWLIFGNATSVSVRFRVTRGTRQLGESQYFPFLISADQLVSVHRPSHPRSISKITSNGGRTQNVGLARQRIGMSYVAFRWEVRLMTSAVKENTTVLQT